MFSFGLLSYNNIRFITRRPRLPSAASRRLLERPRLACRCPHSRVGAALALLGLVFGRVQLKFYRVGIERLNQQPLRLGYCRLAQVLLPYPTLVAGRGADSCRILGLQLHRWQIHFEALMVWLTVVFRRAFVRNSPLPYLCICSPFLRPLTSDIIF